MSKQALSISYPLLLQYAECINFDSPRSLLEFDLVMINWETIFQELTTNIASTGRDWLKTDTWNKVSVTMLHRMHSINECINHGRFIVIFATNSPKRLRFQDDYGNIVSANLAALIPKALLDTYEVHGDKIEAAKDAPQAFKTFVNSVKDYLTYYATLGPNDGITVMNIAGTGKPVAKWYPNKESGGIFLCPYPKNTAESHRLFVHNLFELLNQLKQPRTTAPPLPEWHTQYLLPDEVKLLDSIRQLKIEQEAIESSISKDNLQLAEALFLKRLITDQGDSLLEAAAKAFDLLGFSVKPGPEQRDDLILDALSGRKFVVEVKGRDTKSAAESDCAQLEKWVSRFYEEHDVEPKGILVINAYRTTPLKERSELTFPNQMLSYATRKQHCLISAYQLLAMCLAVQQGKLSQIDAQNSILKSDGVCQLYPTVADCIALFTLPKG